MRESGLQIPVSHNVRLYTGRDSLSLGALGGLPPRRQEQHMGNMQV